MGSGDFAGAILFNPLGPVLLAGVIALLLIRLSKLFVPKRDDWNRADLALAGVMAVAMIARTIQFYAG